MTIDEFIEQEKNTLYAFKTYWKNQEDLPSEMDAGDWDDQFDFFVDQFGE